jgi:copper(I)-binding protein
LSNVLRRIVLASLSAAALAVAPAWAGEASSSGVEFQNLWIRKPPPGVDTAALYFTVQNKTSSPVTLRDVKSPLAAHAMIHETSVVEGQSRMRMQESVTVPAGGRLVFQPEGLHVMLTGLKKTLEVGDKVPLTVEMGGTRSTPGSLELIATVRPLDAK